MTEAASRGTGDVRVRDVRVREAIQRLEAPLVRYAARITRDVERARDVVQEAFLRLCAQPPGVEDHVAEWLFTVVRHAALNVARKEGRMTTDTGGALAAHAVEREAPGASIERAEAGSALLRELAALPAAQQEVVRLKFQEGQSYKEIARVTGHSVSNVGVLLHRALKALRERLEDGPGRSA